MTGSRRTSLVIGAALVVLLVASATLVIRHQFGSPLKIAAHFTTATAIYPGDEVRVAGVKVGTIDGIEPNGADTKVFMSVDREVPIPADAKAIIVAQNLVSSRYVQLTPAYEETGPTMPDGTVIPLQRTATPVEWDDVKKQLTALATELGPVDPETPTSAGRFVESAAQAMDGNGEKLRDTLRELSAVGRILADGSGDIVAIIRNLQKFVTALRDSNQQIVLFQNRFATLTSVLDDSRSDFDAALRNLAEAVGEVKRFVSQTRGKTAEQIGRLANVTQNLVDHRMDVEQLLHAVPPSIANAYNMFDPRSGGASGVFIVNNFSNPVMFICGMLGAIENVTATETGKMCAQSLGPGLRLANFNYLPFPFNPFLTSAPSPARMRYSEPWLAPGANVSTPQNLPEVLFPAESPPS